MPPCLKVVCDSFDRLDTLCEHPLGCINENLRTLAANTQLAVDYAERDLRAVHLFFDDHGTAKKIRDGTVTESENGRVTVKSQTNLISARCRACLPRWAIAFPSKSRSDGCRWSID